MDSNHTDLKKLSFSASFFSDEVRDGFYIPEMMKRYWAGHLTVLAEVDKICKKHGIPYYADSGTLLGAVRHGGFIPWDDDIDITMMRHDLQKFVEVAERELPTWLSVLDIQTQEDVEDISVAVMSDPSMPDHMERFHGCPYRCNVDIFALDATYEKEEDEKKHFDRYLEVFLTTAYFVDWDEAVKQGPQAVKRLLSREAMAAVRKVEKMCGVSLDKTGDLYRQLLRLLIRVAREVSDTESSRLIRFLTPELTYHFRKEWFGKPVWLPFEFFSFPVPKDYDRVLTSEFKDWRRIVRGSAEHEYPAYAEQEAQLIANNGGCHPFRYSFREQNLDAPRTPSLREQTQQIVSLLEKTQKQALFFAKEKNETGTAQLLIGCQKLVLKLGELLEGALSKTSEAVVATGVYAEALFRQFEQPTADSAATLSRAFEALRTEIERAFVERREVVFVAIRPSFWKTFEKEYCRAMAEEGTKVIVIPATLYLRNPDGSTGEVYSKTEHYPPEVQLTMPEDYSFAERRPERVFIQFPFDGTNRSMVVAPTYYAENLRNYTEHLVYIPCFEAAEPDEKDEISRRTLRILIEQPAVVFADEVRVSSGGMRALYVDVLTEIAGSRTREIWEKKVVCQEE